MRTFQDNGLTIAEYDSLAERVLSALGGAALFLTLPGLPQPGIIAGSFANLWAAISCLPHELGIGSDVDLSTLRTAKQVRSPSGLYIT